MFCKLSVLFVCFFLLSPLSAFAEEWEGRSIQDILETEGEIIVEGIKLDKKAVKKWYERREYLPAWISDNFIYQHSYYFLEAMEYSYHEGLNPSDYPVNLIRKRIFSEQPLSHVNTELLITDSILRYIYDLKSGRKRGQNVDFNLFTEIRAIDPTTLLDEALQAKSLAEYVTALVPQNQEYRVLRDALARYRDIKKKGGFTKIPSGPVIKIGMVDARISKIYQRLTQEELALEKLPGNQATYEGEIVSAIKKFQKLHGLTEDGTIGPATMAALNTPVERRITQLILSMERWRWLPKDLGKKYVIVNIAAFSLEAFDENKEALSMKVIVGKPYYDTPVMSTEVTDITFHPYWHVPKKLAIEKLLPEIRKDQTYLERNGFDVLEQGENNKLQYADTSQLNWQTLQDEEFHYILRQKPGPINSLGKIRFSIRNDLSIYLHDTPDNSLFLPNSRAFSAGCIRLEDPLAFAYFLLDVDSSWDKEKIKDIYNEKAEEGKKLRSINVKLLNPIPINILYWTSWVDREGQVNFREDIYGRDKMLIAALGLE